VTMGSAFDILLAGLVISVAMVAIVTRDNYGAIIAFVTYGLLLGLVWFRIGAPDVALTEAAVGSGITGGLLLSASTRLKRAEARSANDRSPTAVRILAVALCSIVSIALAWVVVILPDPAPTLAPAAVASLPAIGLGNPVSATLIAYRGVDTLLEAVALLLALVGVWSLAPDRFWGGLPGPRPRRDAGSALTLLARVLVPPGIVIGLYIFWVGGEAPGGEFQGSAILGALWILAMIAGLVDAPAVGRRWLRLVLVFGPIVFMGVGFAGFAIAAGFLAYPINFAKPLILVIEIALVLSIASMLAMLVAGSPRRRQRP
jgi:multisubunit Na+/H+ antiporter MnhB subunit